MDSWVVIAVYGRDNTDNRGWLWLSVVSRVGKLHITAGITFALSFVAIIPLGEYR
jgi:hypothetical protein